MTTNQRIILRLIVIAVAVLLLYAVASAKVSTGLTQAEAFSASLRLNQGRFADPNVIQPGELVLVQTDYGVIEMRASAPVNGRYDCIWDCVSRGLQEAEANEKARLLENMRTKNSADEFAVKVNEASPEESKKRSRHLWLLALLPAFIFGERWRRLAQEKKHDPDNYPPVGPNLTEAPMAEVVEEIAKTLEPGFQILDVQRLYLKRTSGPQKISVTMNFADGVWREVWLKPGESICLTKVKNQNGQISRRWFRSACTNGMFSGLFGHLELPQGWSLVLQETIVAKTQIQVPVIAEVPVPVSYEPATSVTTFASQMTEERTEQAPAKKAPASTPKKRLRCRFRHGRGSCRFQKHLRGPRNRRMSRLADYDRCRSRYRHQNRLRA